MPDIGQGQPAPPPAPADPLGRQAKTTYRNPLRAIQGLKPERKDMGVDYGGSGPIYAPGPGVITESDYAWAGGVGAVGPGTFITERLASGPLAGKYVYFSENITPEVRPGQRVTTNTVIGRATGQGAGIETGYAAGPTGATTMAMAAGQTPVCPPGVHCDPGANTTAFGQAWSNVLHYLGAPAGTQGGPHVGSLPRGWWDPGGASGPGSGSMTPQPATAQTTSAVSSVGSAVKSAGALLSGAADVLDHLFALFRPGQGWRLAFGIGGGLALFGAVRSWRSVADNPDSGGMPLAILLSGAAALGGFIALRPWPSGEQPIPYLAETLTGQPPAAGTPPPSEHDAIEAGLAVILGAWLLSKLSNAAGGLGGIIDTILGALGLKGLMGGGGGGEPAPEVPPIEPPIVPV